MGSSSRLLTGAALLVWLAPQALSLCMAMHVLIEHHDESHGTPISTFPPTHGHFHEQDTTDHEHDALASTSGARTKVALLALAPTPRSKAFEPATHRPTRELSALLFSAESPPFHHAVCVLLI